MSLTTTRPLRMAGANVNSGFPNTGEVAFTNGGMKTACIFSGALAPALTQCPTGAGHSGGSQVLLVSGAGRLNQIIPHGFLTSGQAVTFYDANVNVASGVGASGQLILGLIPTRSRGTLAVASGAVDTVVTWQDQITINMPYANGLCVAAASGAPGFTVAYTPETN